MFEKTEDLIPVQFPQVVDEEVTAAAGVAPSKKAFVEPEVSFPVDVLDSTTFFQFTESGVSN